MACINCSAAGASYRNWNLGSGPLLRLLTQQSKVQLDFANNDGDNGCMLDASECAKDMADMKFSRSASQRCWFLSSEAFRRLTSVCVRSMRLLGKYWFQQGQSLSRTGT